MKGNITKSLTLMLCLGLSLAAYSQRVTGVVSDKTGPLPGVNILVEGTQLGAATNFDGSYEIKGLEAGKTYTVAYSFLGYTTVKRTFTLNKNQVLTLSILMQEETNRLDEVVVVGYGVQRKRDVTGSIVKLQTKDLTDMPSPSFETAIQGKAAGVQVITGSGLAGSGSVVRVRGIASISGSGDPLYVVDGIPITQDYFLQGNSGAMNNNPLATLNPNDIESVEVLKDASATGIYGSRGANGVILITTKKGKSPEWTFNFSSRLGTSQPVALPNMLNTQEYLQLYKEAWTNDGRVGVPVLPGGISWEDAQKVNTNWIDEVIRLGFKQNYNLSGGKQGKNYNIYGGISHDVNESYLIGNSFERTTGRLNISSDLSKKLKLSGNFSLAQGINNRVDEGWAGGLGAASSTALPYFPILSSDTNRVYFNGGTNPVRQRELRTWRNRELRSINNITLTYNPIKDLYITLNTNYDYMDLTEDNFFQAELLNVTGRDGDASRNTNRVHNYNAFLTANYTKQLNKDHRLSFLAGIEAQENYRLFSSIQDTTLSGAFFENREALRDNPFTFQAPANVTRFISAFARVNWNIKEKYIFQAVMRTDGSSNFGPDNRFGFFPSASAGWVLSEEDFLKNNRVINFMKLKTSFGIAGVAPPAADLWRVTFGVDSIIGYDGQPILYPNILNNPSLKWETSRIFDFGIENGFFEDRITTEIGYYYKYSTDVFLNVSLPGYAGFDNFFDNLATIYNQGVEFTLRSRNLVKGKLKWTTEFNISRNWNKITDISGYSEEAVSGGTNDTRVVVGSPVGTNFLVRHSHVDPATGRPVYLDINGNETFTWNPDDRVPVGSVLPDAIGGITNSFQYQNWDLSFLFVFTIGGNIYDSSSKRQLGTFDNDGWNKRTDIYDRWQRPGDIARYPRLSTTPETYGSGTPWINTDLWLHDASYARLRNLTLGYNLPKKLANKYKMNSCRLTFVATNILTFTRFIGLDPEIARDFENITDRNMSPNITYLTPPQEKTFNFGIDITF